MNQEAIVHEFQEMGFDISLIAEAYQKCKGNKEQMFDLLFKMKYIFLLSHRSYLNSDSEDNRNANQQTEAYTKQVIVR